MRHLLEKALQRHLSILESLQYEEQLRIEDLRKKLRYSSKTLLSDLPEINSYISPASIESCRGGYALQIPENYSFDYIYSCILKKSDRFTLLETLFFKGSQTYIDLADLLFTSESTLKRLLSSFNPLLRPLGFHVETRPIRISGDGGAIIQFFVAYFSEKYSNPLDAFPVSEQAAIKQLLVFWREKNHLTLPSPDTNLLSLWLLTSYHRKMELDLLESTPDMPSIRGVENLEVENTDILSVLRTAFSDTNSEERIRYVIENLFPYGFVLSPSLIEESYANFPDNRQVYQCAVDLIHALSSYFNLSVQNYDNFVLDLFNLFNLARSLKLPRHILNDKARTFFEKADEQEKALYYVLEELLEDLRLPGYAWNQSDYYELFYILITHWTDFLPNIQKRRKKIRIGLYYDTDIEHSRYLKKQLEFLHGNHTEVRILDDFAEKNRHELDLILTNRQGLTSTEYDVMCTGLMLTSQDWYRIEKRRSQPGP